MQDLDRTWTDTVTTLTELSARIENLAGRVAAIAVTGQGDGTWMIDRAGDPDRQRLALARRACWRHGRAPTWRQRRCRAFRQHRLRACRVPARRAAALDERQRAGNAVRRCNHVSLQGLALLQADANACHGSLRSQLHLRQLPHPQLQRRRHPLSRPSEAQAFPARDRRRGDVAPPAFVGGSRRHRSSRRARRWCSAMSMSSARHLAPGSTIQAPTPAARSSARPACTCALPRAPTTCGSTVISPATPCACRSRTPMRRCSRTWRRRSTSTGSCRSPAAS